MDELSKLFERYCYVMKQNNKGAQLGVYSVALIGLSIAMRRVRPISRFVKPSDVPNLFIQKRKLLNGRVESIDPSGLLMVKHKPPIPFPMRSQGTLPVKISGVNVSGNGVSWLQAIVAGNEINFIPITKQNNCIHCEVVLPQMTQKKKIRNVNVAQSLIEIGFGKLDRQCLDNATQFTYINTLKAAENRALRKEMGIKYYVKPTKLILISIANKLGRLMDKIKRNQTLKVPKVIM